MKKLMELKKRKKNNKGFSLVELIIVIAIMAVLVAVLAPQFLKYVERSRNSTDAQNATAIATALQTYYADPSTDLTSVTTGTITVSSAGITIGTNDKFSSAALSAAGIDIKTKCKSKSTWTQYIITWAVKDGAMTITYSSGTTGTTTGTDPFTSYMASGSTSTSASK